MSEKVSPKVGAASASTTTRRPANAPPGRRSSASAAALRAGQRGGEDYFTPAWGLLLAAFTTLTLLFFLFTPYTHQLDEIKNVILMTIPPFLLAFAVWKKDFSTINWRSCGPMILLGAYVLVMIISYLLNPYKPIAERVVWFQFGVGTFTVLFAWYMDSEAKLRKTMMYFVLLALASTILGLILVAGQGFTDAIYNAIRDRPEWRTAERQPWVTLFYTLKENKEMYSSVLNSDFYAAFLVMTIPIPLAMFFVERHLVHKTLALATFLLMNVCLFLTNSNDSYMSIIVAYVIFFGLGYFYVKDWGLSRQFIITFLSGSTILAITVIVLMWPTLARTWDFKSEAISGRGILWEGGFWPWLYFDDATRSSVNLISFLFGTGPGGYRFYFPVFRDPAFFDNQINNVTTFGHNLYLDVLMETGLLGLLTFLGFYFLILWNGFQQVRRTDNPVYRFYQIALVAGLIGIALQNFFSPNYRWAVAGTVYWALFGISIGLFRMENWGAVSSPADRQKKDGPPWPLIAKGAAAVFVGLFLLRSPWQGVNYWGAAVANGTGLRALDYADTYSRAGDEQRAIPWLQTGAKLFETAIEKNPTFVTSYYKLAHVYNQLGDVDGATRTYEELQAVNPNYSEIHQNLSIMYSLQARELDGEEQLKKLEAAYAEAVEGARQSLKPNMQWLAGSIGEELAMYYLAAQQDDKAQAIYEHIKQYYRSIIEYKPVLPQYAQERLNYYARAHVKLVRLAELTGKPQEAEPVLQQMYRDNPDKPQYLEQLMAYYTRYGTPEGRIKFLESAVDGDPLDVELRRRLAEAHLEAKDENSYRKELRRIEILAPDDKEALASLYASYQRTNDQAKEEEYRSKLQAVGASPNTEATTVGAEVLTQPAVPSPAPPQDTSPTTGS